MATKMGRPAMRRTPLTDEQRRMVEEHIRLAYWAAGARRFRRWVERIESSDPGGGLSAALLGLVRAAHRFDPTRGFTFATYAVAQIRYAIADAAGVAGKSSCRPNSRGIRIPASLAFSQIASVDSEVDPASVADALVSVGENPPRYSEEELDALRRAIGYLHPIHRQVLQRRMDGKTFHEIATEFGKTKQWACHIMEMVEFRLRRLLHKGEDGCVRLDTESGTRAVRDAMEPFAGWLERLLWAHGPMRLGAILTALRVYRTEPGASQFPLSGVYLTRVVSWFPERFCSYRDFGQFILYDVVRSQGGSCD